MQEDEFYTLVQQGCPVDSTDQARTATHAVLETLAETVTGGEAEDVAAQLPDELAEVLDHADHDGAEHDRESFVSRVGDRLHSTDLDPAEAERYADAVTDALAESLTRGELEDLTAQLGGGLDPLFQDVDVDRDRA